VLASWFLASPARPEENCGSMVETVARFRGVVTAVEPLGRGGLALTPVDADPRFAVSVEVDGETRHFGVHSPARTFATDPAVGAELDLELRSLACDGSFRRFVDLRERGPMSAEPFEGRLEVGKAYTTRIRWDRDAGLVPRERLTGPRHHAVGIDWKNLAEFPELKPEGGLTRISFEVVERRTDHRGERQWVTLYGCRIVEVGRD
jgi:hypothetical protein